MKVPTTMIKKAAVQKRKKQVAAGGKKKPHPQTPPPLAQSHDANKGAGPSSPQLTDPPSTPQVPSAVDLTTDSPPDLRIISPAPNVNPTTTITETELLPEKSAPTGGSGEAVEPSASPIPEERGARASHPRVSLAYNGRIVKRLMMRVCLSELQAEFQELETAAIYQNAFAAHLWAVNSLAALRDITLRSHHAHQMVLAMVAQAEEALESVRWEAKRALEATRGKAEGA